ncbi:MAG: response regulator [Rhodospirillaceae bacterium]
MPDVIFMDINLPGIDGYETNIRLKKEARTADIPVIAHSAAAMPYDIAKGIEAGFHTYLTKPFNIDEIMASIESALKGPYSRES